MRFNPSAAQHQQKSFCEANPLGIPLRNTHVVPHFCSPSSGINCWFPQLLLVKELEHATPKSMMIVINHQRFFQRLLAINISLGRCLLIDNRLLSILKDILRDKNGLLLTDYYPQQSFFEPLKKNVDC